MMHALKRTISVLSLILVCSATRAVAQPTPIDLGAIPAARTVAWAVNNHGVVPGYLDLGRTGTHAFLATPERGIVDLTPNRRGSAFDVNDAGQVVGWAEFPGGFQRAVMWTRDGDMVPLGYLGGPHSLALKVNQAGQVFGRSLISATSSIAHGFVWTDNGGMMDLGPLPPTLNDVPETNNTGQMIFYTANQVERGFLWTPHSGSVDLGTLGGSTSAAWGLNNLGDVVGSADTAPEGLSHAFIWTPTEGMVDLGTLGGYLQRRDGRERRALGRRPKPDGSLQREPRKCVPLDTRRGHGRPRHAWRFRQLGAGC